MRLRADLHIHSCLSPCGSLDMSPSRIAACAAAAGLDLIALTDHNSALNCPAMEKAVSRYDGLGCLYGMELSSTEEVHALALFDRCDDALSFGEFIYYHLPGIVNDAERFGDQVYVDESDNILGSVDRHLVAGLDITIDDLEVLVHERGGLFIPTHIDRELYSMTSQLGFLPEGNYDAVEFSARFVGRGGNPRAIDKSARYAWITNSDSHYPDSIGAAFTEIECDDATISGLRSAFHDRSDKREQRVKAISGQVALGD